MIKQIKIMLLLLLTGSMATAQILSPQTISAAGKSSSNAGVLLEYSVGALLQNTVNTASSMYTQGFMQPDAGTTAGPIYINNVTLSGGTVTDNAGTTFINGGAMIEFTVGEMASKTLINGNMLTQGILQPYTSGVLPVTGLELYAKRISNNKVQLDWKTQQEINNRGFYVERKKENENNFTEQGFTASSAAGGNSSFPLSYVKTDDNDFSGITYYRLKQVDIDGRFVYSVVRIVNGEDSKQTLMKVWPVPSSGPVHVLVNGITKGETLQVFDMSGKLVQQMNVLNNNQVQLSGLTAGSYLVKLVGQKDVQQKIIIQ